MKKKISKPIMIGGIAVLIGIAVLAAIVLMFGGGKEEVSKDPLNLYNKIVVGMPRVEAEKALKVEGSVKGKGFNYVDENTGYGVTVSYNKMVTEAADGSEETEGPEVVVFKSLFVPDNTYIDGLVNANVTADQVNTLKEGMTYEEVKTILGGADGTEINSAYNKKDAENSYTVMAWFNPDRSVAYVTFLGYQGTVMVFEFRPE